MSISLWSKLLRLFATCCAVSVTAAPTIAAPPGCPDEARRPLLTCQTGSMLIWVATERRAYRVCVEDRFQTEAHEMQDEVVKEMVKVLRYCEAGESLAFPTDDLPTRTR